MGDAPRSHILPIAAMMRGAFDVLVHVLAELVHLLEETIGIDQILRPVRLLPALVSAVEAILIVVDRLEVRFCDQEIDLRLDERSFIDLVLKGVGCFESRTTGRGQQHERQNQLRGERRARVPLNELTFQDELEAPSRIAAMLKLVEIIRSGADL